MSEKNSNNGDTSKNSNNQDTTSNTLINATSSNTPLPLPTISINDDSNAPTTPSGGSVQSKKKKKPVKKGKMIRITGFTEEEKLLMQTEDDSEIAPNGKPLLSRSSLSTPNNTRKPLRSRSNLNSPLASNRLSANTHSNKAPSSDNNANTQQSSLAVPNEQERPIDSTIQTTEQEVVASVPLDSMKLKNDKNLDTFLEDLKSMIRQERGIKTPPPKEKQPIIQIVHDRNSVTFDPFQDTGRKSSFTGGRRQSSFRNKQGSEHLGLELGHGRKSIVGDQFHGLRRGSMFSHTVRHSSPPKSPEKHASVPAESDINIFQNTAPLPEINFQEEEEELEYIPPTITATTTRHSISRRLSSVIRNPFFVPFTPAEDFILPLINTSSRRKSSIITPNNYVFRDDYDQIVPVIHELSILERPDTTLTHKHEPSATYGTSLPQINPSLRAKPVKKEVNDKNKVEKVTKVAKKLIPVPPTHDTLKVTESGREKPSGGGSLFQRMIKNEPKISDATERLMYLDRIRNKPGPVYKYRLPPCPRMTDKLVLWHEITPVSLEQVVETRLQREKRKKHEAEMEERAQVVGNGGWNLHVKPAQDPREQLNQVALKMKKLLMALS